MFHRQLPDRARALRAALLAAPLALICGDFVTTARAQNIDEIVVNWNLSVWGKNLSDEMAVLDYSFSGLGRVLSQLYIPPRTVGATFNCNF